MGVPHVHYKIMRTGPSKETRHSPSPCEGVLDVKPNHHIYVNIIYDAYMVHGKILSYNWYAFNHVLFQYEDHFYGTFKIHIIYKFVLIHFCVGTKMSPNKKIGQPKSSYVDFKGLSHVGKLLCIL